VVNTDVSKDYSSYSKSKSIKPELLDPEDAGTAVPPASLNEARNS